MPITASANIAIFPDFIFKLSERERGKYYIITYYVKLHNNETWVTGLSQATCWGFKPF
jgi:hypothetical protein